MPHRMTDRARKAVTLALRCARHRGHNTIMELHLLYGLVAEGSGVAAKILNDAGADLEHITRALGLVPAPDPRVSQDITNDRALTAILNAAEEKAKGLRHNYVGTKHLLLAVVDAIDLSTVCSVTSAEAARRTLRIIGAESTVHEPAAAAAAVPVQAHPERRRTTLGLAAHLTLVEYLVGEAMERFEAGKAVVAFEWPADGNVECTIKRPVRLAITSRKANVTVRLDMGGPTENTTHES